EALAMARKLFGNEHPRMAETLNDLVSLLLSEGKPAEAEHVLSEVLTPAAENDRKSVGLMRARGNLRAQHGPWKEAAADYSKVVEFDPENHEGYHRLAPLLVQSDALEAYRSHCARTRAHFGGTNDPVIAERMAKDCLLLPSPATDLTTESKWADTAVTVGKN